MTEEKRQIKTIGVLTSGGDAPGMNAAVRAVVRTAIYYGISVKGIRRGYNGLINGDMIDMDARSVSDILHKGGTILQTARSDEFKTIEGMAKAVRIAKMFEIDGIVVVGGDGSFRGAKDLCELGVPAVGIPATIDNDIACSDYTIGFDTAVNTAMQCVDKLRDTISSHGRSSVVEVMGRHAGHIALHVAVANGAESVIIPEKQYDFDKDVLQPIIKAKNRGKKHDIIIVAEGVGNVFEIDDKITEMSGSDTRATVLGHIQRGGSPTAYDRVMASRFGAYAVELLRSGAQNRVVAFKNGTLVDFDIVEALNMKKGIEEGLYNLSKILAI